MPNGTNGNRLPRALVTALATVVAAAALAGGALSQGGPASAPHLTLTILHSNDGESRLLNAGTGALALYGGIARFATVVENLRQEAISAPRGRGTAPKRAVLMLSSGDNFLAGPQFNASLAKGPPFYDTIALDAIGYDAFAIGNHEFDFGPGVLADFIEGFEGHTPFLSANLDFSGEPRLQSLVRSESDACVRSGSVGGRGCGGHIAASTIVQKQGERIGIVGATTPLLPAISSPGDVEVIEDVAGEVQDEIDRLRAQRVGIIILISHLQNLNADLALAPMLEGLDVMIAGGGDELLANPGTPLVPGDVLNPQRPYPMFATLADGTQIPVVTTAGDYKYVGKLTVDFDRQGRLVRIHNGPVRVSGNPADPDAVEPDPEIQEAVVEPVAQAVADLQANVVATSEVALEGRSPDPLRLRETNLGNLMADALRWQGEQLAASFGVAVPEVGIQNAGGIRNNSLIPAGPITEFDTFSIAAFSNFVSVVANIPPAQLKELLENGVSRLPLADGRFTQVSGLSFTYSLSGTPQVVDNDGNVLTPGTRVRSVTLDDGTPIVVGGQVVAGAPSVSIATNDFSARGGDQYPFRGAPFTNLAVSYQQALLNYLTSPAGLDGVVPAALYPEGGSGRIVGMP